MRSANGRVFSHIKPFAENVDDNIILSRHQTHIYIEGETEYEITVGSDANMRKITFFTQVNKAM